MTIIVGLTTRQKSIKSVICVPDASLVQQTISSNDDRPRCVQCAESDKNNTNQGQTALVSPPLLGRRWSSRANNVAAVYALTSVVGCTYCGTYSFM